MLALFTLLAAALLINSAYCATRLRSDAGKGIWPLLWGGFSCLVSLLTALAIIASMLIALLGV